MDVLMVVDATSKTDIRKGLGMLRTLLELLIDLACQRHLAKSPESFMLGQGSRTRHILDHLQRNILSAELFASASALYKICSKYGSHNERMLSGKPPAYTPGRYGFARAINAYLELLMHLI